MEDETFVTFTFLITAFIQKLRLIMLLHILWLLRKTIVGPFTRDCSVLPSSR